MARKAVHRRLQPPPPPLQKPESSSARFAEVAGGTAAGCTAICCCLPCGLLNLLVLTVVRLPAGLCRKALRKQRMKRRAGAAVAGKKVGYNAGAAEKSVERWPALSPPAEAAEMEREMWTKFYSAGFWRSPSQREEQYPAALSLIEC